MGLSKLVLAAVLLVSFQATAQVTYTEDNCLDGQDLNAEDVDITNCPVLPNDPNDATLPNGEVVSLGAWELGQTAEGETYAINSLSEPNGDEPRTFGESVMTPENITCWAKGYYRLRKILQNPPADWIKLKDAGYQGRFFQFQTDLRNGPTGFREITSYMDHLIKWVTRIDPDGTCVQPTNGKFQEYLSREVRRRGL